MTLLPSEFIKKSPLRHLKLQFLLSFAVSVVSRLNECSINTQNASNQRVIKSNKDKMIYVAPYLHVDFKKTSQIITVSHATILSKTPWKQACFSDLHSQSAPTQKLDAKQKTRHTYMVLQIRPGTLFLKMCLIHFCAKGEAWTRRKAGLASL